MGKIKNSILWSLDTLPTDPLLELCYQVKVFLFLYILSDFKIFISSSAGSGIKNNLIYEHTLKNVNMDSDMQDMSS